MRKESIIPIDIISLCILFWNKPLRFVICDQNKIKIYDREDKHISLLKNNLYKLSPPLCHIENIASPMKSNRLYDGILCVLNPDLISTWDESLFLMYYEPTSVKNEQIECHEIKSNQRLLDDRCQYTLIYRSFLYCGKYGVIHEYNGNLYQLKLQDINHDFSFNQIQVEKKHQIWDFNGRSKWVARYLSLAYLPKTHTIFAIFNHYGRISFTANTKRERTDPTFI